MKHEAIPSNQVLTWLHEHHPELLESIEIDRSWVWITANLQEKPDIRQSLKEYGFVFARRGHTLPSGFIGRWGHSCDAPQPFMRRAGAARPTKRDNRVTSTKPSPELQQRKAEECRLPGRYDPLADVTPLPVPPHQGASEIDPELAAWIGAG